MSQFLSQQEPAPWGRSKLKHLRLLVVDDKADEVSVVGGPVAFPGQFDPFTAGAVGFKL